MIATTFLDFARRKFKRGITLTPRFMILTSNTAHVIYEISQNYFIIVLLSGDVCYRRMLYIETTGVHFLVAMHYTVVFQSTTLISVGHQWPTWQLEC